MEGHRKETVFIIEWVSLPDEWKAYVKDKFDHYFRNDIMFTLPSEFEPTEGDHWGETLSQESIAGYHSDQVETNGFEGDLEHFIEDYSLQFEVWMLEQGFDLNGVTTILIDVSW